LNLVLESVEDAEGAGLVRVADGRLSFRHPLVRAAVYHAASPAARRRTHASLARALDGPEDAARRAWHAAAALLEADAAVADALEQTAEDARRRGGLVAEARALERAAQITP